MKNIIRLSVVIVLFLAVSNNAFCKGPGSTSGSILLEPLTASSPALADTGSALYGKGSCMDKNPAGLNGLEGQEVSIIYRKGFSGGNYAGTVYARDMKDFSAAAAIKYYSTGSIDMYTPDNEKIAKTGKKDIALIISGSDKISGIPVGINLKYISSEIFGVKASAFAADIGAQFRDIIKGIDTGITIKNIGTQLKYISVGEALPLHAVIGVAHEKNFDSIVLTGLLDVPYYLHEGALMCLLGVELKYDEMFYFRIGYKLNLDNSQAEDQAISLGVGVDFNRYSLEYAMGIAGNLNMPHNLSLRIGF
ncbi:PorV/PorQ family protein [Elusimicrobiota bacterium]